jgi:DNA-directed RNA polymerase delta subunit
MIDRTQTSYEQDYYQWAIEQAKALRERNLDHLDWENIIEEIESLGKRDYRSVRNLLMRLIEHKLKREFIPLPSCYRKWEVESKVFQNNIKSRYSPAMKPKLETDLAEIYEDAMGLVEAEYGFDLPIKCPYCLEDLLP